MALIQKIRSKTTLTLFLMAIAIIGFVAMDIVRSGEKSGRGVSTSASLVKVNGESLDINEFQAREKILNPNSTGDAKQRTDLFNEFVDGALVQTEADAIGLGVSKDELRTLEFGPNYSPELNTNLYIKDQNGQPSGQKLQEIEKAITGGTANNNPEFVQYWTEWRKKVVNTRLKEKLNSFVSMGVYTPTWMVDQAYDIQSKPVDFQFVRIPLDQVKDDEVKLTDADYQTFLDGHKGRYMQDEETRKMEYVAFNVVATPADSAKLLTEVEANAAEFRTTTKDSAFAVTHGGGVNPTFVNKEGLSPASKDKIYGSPVGVVVGPYVESKAYWLAKVLERKGISDSVRSRHILFGSIKSNEEFVATQKKADSLRTMLEKGQISFDQANMQYSTDSVAKMRGGDVGFIGKASQFAPQYLDQVMYKSEPGKFYTVATQFGVHIIQVTEKKGKVEDHVKVAYIRKAIMPGNETVKAAEEAANSFLTGNRTLEAMRKSAAEKGLQILTTSPIKQNDYELQPIGTGNSARDLVKWAFNNDKTGNVSPALYSFSDQGDNYVSRHVVVALKSIAPKGMPSVANMKEELTPMVKNMKKAEILKGKVVGTDLATIAATYSSKIDTAKQVTFNSSGIPNLGMEPSVVGTVFGLKENVVSKAIAGDNGVYVVKVVNTAPQATMPVDKNAIKEQLSAPMKNIIRGKLIQSLKRNANIVDNRYKFY
jgi:peptidyl-prolyl cis-trans isomerase D